MIDRPFLTLIDPRARIKGSRDPLGLQPIWTHFGRQVVYNLTTVTTSLRGFTVLLLGLYFAERTVEEFGAEEAKFADLFLKFEQLAAYSRVAWRGDGYSEDEIRGIQRVQRNLNEGKGHVLISADQEGQILANQRTYGLWGLYSVAARNSGWLEPDCPRLTRETRDYVEAEYLPKFAHRGGSIFPFLRKERYFEPCGKDSLLGRSLANLLNPELTQSERAFYFRHLVAGGQETIQQILWEHIKHANHKSFNWVDPFSMSELQEVVKLSRSSGDHVLAERLERIRLLESVIGPAGRLFGFILSRDDQIVDDVVQEVKSVWGARLDHVDAQAFSRTLTADAGIDSDIRTRLSQVAEALAAGHYREVIDLLLAQNRAMMKARGGDAWAKLKGQHLSVRFREESGDLPSHDELPELWTNTYFINSLKLIGYQIEQSAQNVK